VAFELAAVGGRIVFVKLLITEFTVVAMRVVLTVNALTRLGVARVRVAMTLARLALEVDTCLHFIVARFTGLARGRLISSRTCAMLNALRLNRRRARVGRGHCH
jgi:hypothetical protein